MLNISLQFFAHKKGMGSTKNGRDSESKRLGPKRADGGVRTSRRLLTHSKRLIKYNSVFLPCQQGKTLFLPVFAKISRFTPWDRPVSPGSTRK